MDQFRASEKSPLVFKISYLSSNTLSRCLWSKSSLFAGVVGAWLDENLADLASTVSVEFVPV